MLPILGLNFLTAADWDRVLTVAFPVVIVLACSIQLRWPILLAFLTVQAWLAGLGLDRITGYYTGHLDHPHKLTIALSAFAVALAVLGATTSRNPAPPAQQTFARSGADPQSNV
jgi:ABC-type branched-subunit amino acid transport system permease subunit